MVRRRISSNRPELMRSVATIQLPPPRHGWHREVVPTLAAVTPPVGTKRTIGNAGDSALNVATPPSSSGWEELHDGNVGVQRELYLARGRHSRQHGYAELATAVNHRPAEAGCDDEARSRGYRFVHLTRPKHGAGADQDLVVDRDAPQRLQCSRRPERHLCAC